MADYIKREDVIALAWDVTYKDEWYMHKHDEVVSVSDIAEIPSADVRPVVRGEWLPIIEANEYGEPYQAGCYCSECNEVLQYEPNFCPNCGARMESEEEDG